MTHRTETEPENGNMGRDSDVSLNQDTGNTNNQTMNYDSHTGEKLR